MPPAPPRLLPPIPPTVRYVLACGLLALLFFSLSSLETTTPTAATVDAPLETVVPVPELDDRILALAKDATHEQRLVLEAEPLRHLLGKAIDVGPTIAAALGCPDAPVPVEQVRTRLARMRRQWLWYEGVLMQLSGPHAGHPIKGHSIYEATVQLADGEHVLAAFSLPPGDEVRAGSWVRIEGFLLKLRDTSYPQTIESAPMLVGRAIQPDFRDWPPVTAIDPALLATIEDASYLVGEKVWHTLEEDQTAALWHLAAFARDTATQRSLADWRRLPVLNATDVHQKLIDGTLPRGSPLRVFGTIVRRTTMAAPTNPAGIASWTVAWLQVRDYGGVLVPIWVPKRVRDLPLRAPLEVRGHFYRWFAYETVENERRRVPLFLAADLDVYQLEVDKTMKSVGLWVGGVACALLLLLFWSQRRTARQALEHSRDMDARRRRRRERTSAADANVQTSGES